MSTKYTNVHVRTRQVELEDGSPGFVVDLVVDFTACVPSIKGAPKLKKGMCWAKHFGFGSADAAESARSFLEESLDAMLRWCRSMASWCRWTRGAW